MPVGSYGPHHIWPLAYKTFDSVVEWLVERRDPRNSYLWRIIVFYPFSLMREISSVSSECGLRCFRRKAFPRHPSLTACLSRRMNSTQCQSKRLEWPPIPCTRWLSPDGPTCQERIMLEIISRDPVPLSYNKTMWDPKESRKGIIDSVAEVVSTQILKATFELQGKVISKYQLG